MSQPEERNELFSIEKHLNRADAKAFWDFTLPQILKLSLSLLCEHAARPVGIVFPLRAKSVPLWQLDTSQLLSVGESFVGLLKDNDAFYSLLTPGPFFEYANDYRLDVFTIAGNDDVLRVIPRHIYPLEFPGERNQKVIRRMLNWLRQQTLQPEFDLAMRGQGNSALLPFQAFDESLPSTIFNQLADMVVQLGGVLPDGRPRWHFSCILLPKDDEPVLPLNQRQLLVYAQSARSPHQIKKTYIPPRGSSLSVSLRALSSGHTMYRPRVDEDDKTVYFSSIERVKSVFAMALRDERNLPQAVLYVGSTEYESFTIEDQCVLRLMGKIIEEAFALTRIYKNSARQLSEILVNPTLVDDFFEKFLSEKDFLEHLSHYFYTIRNGEKARDDQIDHQNPGALEEEQRLALVMLDLKNQPMLAATHGDLAVRNLTSQMGERLQGLMVAFFSIKVPLYYSCGSRFCFFVEIDKHEAIVLKIKNMWSELNSPYFVSVLQTIPTQPVIPETKLSFTDIKMCAVVASYQRQTLRTILEQGKSDNTLSNSMLSLLERGLIECENYEKGVILSWISEKRQYSEESI